MIQAMSNDVSGTQGYAENAVRHIEQWENMSFSDLHADLVHLMPRAPADVLDISAGSGRDAAALVGLEYTVMAVEPMDAFRAAAASNHPSDAITWLDDSLPDLGLVRATHSAFDLVMLTALWMHLDESQRAHAMPILASLLRDDGILAITLRHGPIPVGRHMLDVSAEETIALAHNHGLHVLQKVESGSVQKKNQESRVHWTHFAFSKLAAA